MVGSLRAAALGMTLHPGDSVGDADRAMGFGIGERFGGGDETAGAEHGKMLRARGGRVACGLTSRKAGRQEETRENEAHEHEAHGHTHKDSRSSWGDAHEQDFIMAGEYRQAADLFGPRAVR